MKRGARDGRSAAVEPLPRSGLKTYSLAQRRSRVALKQFAAVTPAGAGVAALFASLPDILAARDLKLLIRQLALAHRKKRRIAVAIGGHVVKCGVSPLLIDLVERGVITSVAFNGGAAIHDLEIGLVGRTSEDVARTLGDGSLGMARETAQQFGRAADEGARGAGLGRALGERVLGDGKHARASLLAACARAGVPATVHVAVGADIVHMHEAVAGAALGEASMIDFRLLAAVVAKLEGGVWMNVGSAVVLPEVFLKAVSLARNLGHRLTRFTTVNLDMVQHYRPRTNVLARPGGDAIAITGHHEILLPLIHAGLNAVLAGERL